MATDPAAGGRRPRQFAVPSDPDPRVSLIVLACRRADLLRACLAALPTATAAGPSCETVIVLNGATPEVRTLVHEDVEGARVVGSPVNLGVAGGANLGRGVARGELLVILHDDAEPRPDWLARLVAVADRHPEAGVVGSRVVDPDGTPQAAGWITLADGGGVPLKDKPASGQVERPVDFCQSCALLVRARLWDSLGGLDEEFYPAYFVDVDLAMAAWQAGWSVLCALDAEVAHHVSASSPSEYVAFLKLRNGARLCQKWAAALSQHVSGPDAGDRAVEFALERVRLLALQCHGAQTPTGLPARPPLGTGRFARGESVQARAERREIEARAEFNAYLARQGIRGRCQRAVRRIVPLRVRRRLLRMLSVLPGPANR